MGILFFSVSILAYLQATNLKLTRERESLLHLNRLGNIFIPAKSKIVKKLILTALVFVGLISCSPVSAVPSDVCQIQNLDLSSLRGWSTPPSLWDGNGINTEMRQSPDGNTVVAILFYGQKPKKDKIIGSYRIDYTDQTQVKYCLPNLPLKLKIGNQIFPVSGIGFQEVPGRLKLFWLD